MTFRILKVKASYKGRERPSVFEFRVKRELNSSQLPRLFSLTSYATPHNDQPNTNVLEWSEAEEFESIFLIEFLPINCGKPYSVMAPDCNISHDKAALPFQSMEALEKWIVPRDECVFTSSASSFPPSTIRPLARPCRRPATTICRLEPPLLHLSGRQPIPWKYTRPPLPTSFAGSIEYSKSWI